MPSNPTTTRTKNNVTLLAGHCLDVLNTIPENSIHTCVTSPPYFGLRNYDTPAQTWGGSPECNHEWHNAALRNPLYGKMCARCGAFLGSLGNEPTPELYVQHIVEIFREVRRVLRPDGTLWLVVGDCYAGPSPSQGLKRKDIVGIPWRVAFALQADGWLLRTDIIWNKSNPMPENVRDRPTRAHEFIFLLSKQSRYYYDRAAIAEPLAPASIRRLERRSYSKIRETPKTQSAAERRAVVNLKGRVMPTDWMPPAPIGSNGAAAADYRKNRRSVWTLPTKPYNGPHFATFPPDLVRLCIRAGCPAGGVVIDPFMGAGTTGLVAAQEGRSAIGIELNQQYLGLAKERVA